MPPLPTPPTMQLEVQHFPKKSRLYIIFLKKIGKKKEKLVEMCGSLKTGDSIPHMKRNNNSFSGEVQQSLLTSLSLDEGARQASPLQLDSEQLQQVPATWNDAEPSGSHTVITKSQQKWCRQSSTSATVLSANDTAIDLKRLLLPSPPLLLLPLIYSTIGTLYRLQFVVAQLQFVCNNWPRMPRMTPTITKPVKH